MGCSEFRSQELHMSAVFRQTFQSVLDAMLSHYIILNTDAQKDLFEWAKIHLD